MVRYCGFVVELRLIGWIFLFKGVFDERGNLVCFKVLNGILV